jgi:predicted HTH transcriptional regulator
LFQQRSQSRLIRFDEQPVPNTSFDDLEPLLSKRFIADSGQPAELQLRKLRLLSHEDDHDQLTVAGVLLGTPEPRQWLPNAYVQAVFYRGTDRDAENQLDAEDISGPLDSQIKKALDFVRRNMRIEAVKRPGRIEIPQYSIRAVFEAIVNAVAHRDYSIYGSKIRLHMFADRLQINSPGALANSMEVDALALRQSTRNELIASLLARCPFNDADVNRSFIMDKRGEGVPVILRESERLSKRRPEYQLIGGEELQLTIYAASREQNGIVEQFE